MAKYAAGIAASDAAIASQDARTMRKQQQVSDVALGVGTMLNAMSAFAARGRHQADTAEQAKILAGMTEHPEGMPGTMPPGVAGPAAPVPWESVIGEKMQQYHPPSLIAHLGAMFSQLGGNQPSGQLQPQAAGELLALAGNRAFQRSQIQLNTMRASAEDRKARAAEINAAANAGRAQQDPIANVLARMYDTNVRSATSLAGRQSMMIAPAEWAKLSPQMQTYLSMQGHAPGDVTSLQPMLSGSQGNAANLQKLLLQRMSGGKQGAPTGAPQQMPLNPMDANAQIRKLLQDRGVDVNDKNFEFRLNAGEYDEFIDQWNPNGGG